MSQKVKKETLTNFRATKTMTQNNNVLGCSRSFM